MQQPLFLSSFWLRLHTSLSRAGGPGLHAEGTRHVEERTQGKPHRTAAGTEVRVLSSFSCGSDKASEKTDMLLLHAVCVN